MTLPPMVRHRAIWGADPDVSPDPSIWSAKAGDVRPQPAKRVA